MTTSNVKEEYSFQPDEISYCHDHLLTWYNKTKRSLPWREESKKSSYGTWVSEIMSQQTRIETVIPYWERWMAKFPTIESLSQADPTEINALWAGLGYYRRCRQLQEGAKVVQNKFNGILPHTVEELLTIPGIGPYTAGAIASIAYNQIVPLVDGNVIRVLSRLRAIEYEASSKEMTKLSWQLAKSLVENNSNDSSYNDSERNSTISGSSSSNTNKTIRKDISNLNNPSNDCDDGLGNNSPSRTNNTTNQPGDFNQGLMELGATVCTPTSPSCDVCPIASICVAKRIVEANNSSNTNNNTNNNNSMGSVEVSTSSKSKSKSIKELFSKPNVKVKIKDVDIENLIDIDSDNTNESFLLIDSSSAEVSIDRWLPVQGKSTSPLLPSSFSALSSTFSSSTTTFHISSVTYFPRKAEKKKPRSIVFSVCVLRLKEDTSSSKNDSIGSFNIKTHTSTTIRNDTTPNTAATTNDVTNNNNYNNNQFKYLFVRRADKGLLAGQWEFPNIVLYEENAGNNNNNVNSKVATINKSSSQNYNRNVNNSKNNQQNSKSIGNEVICIDDDSDINTPKITLVSANEEVAATETEAVVVIPEDMIFTSHQLWSSFPSYFKNTLQLPVAWHPPILRHQQEHHHHHQQQQQQQHKSNSVDQSTITNEVYFKEVAAIRDTSNTSNIKITKLKPIIHIFSHQKHIMHITIKDVELVNISNNSNTVSSGTSLSSSSSSSSSSLVKTTLESSIATTTTTITSTSTSTSLKPEFSFLTAEEIEQLGITSGCKKILQLVQEYSSTSSSSFPSSIPSSTDESTSSNIHNNNTMDKTIIASTKGKRKASTSLISSTSTSTASEIKTIVPVANKKKKLSDSVENKAKANTITTKKTIDIRVAFTQQQQ